MSEADKNKVADSSSSPSDTDTSDSAFANQKLFENKKWFLPETEEINDKQTKVIKWDHKETYLIKDLLNKVDSTAQMYNLAAIDSKVKNVRWSRLQQLLCFLATFFAFVNASSMPALFASDSMSVESIGSFLSLIIGFLSIALTAVAEIQKKGNFVVKISKYTEIRDDYLGIRLYLESENRFHKTKAVVLEAKVTRMLQELAIVHQSVNVPTEIQLKMETMIDYTQEDVNKCNVGMGREEIVETYQWITEAQRKVRRKKIAKASGLRTEQMEEIDARVKQERKDATRRDHLRSTRRLKRKKTQKQQKFSNRNIIAPMEKFEKKLDDFREKCKIKSNLSSPEKMKKITQQFYRDVSERCPMMEKETAGNDGDDEEVASHRDSMVVNRDSVMNRMNEV